jgi:nitrate reductase NapA
VEKEGVYGQGERRYQLIEKLLEAPGQCRSDLQILVDLADRLGHSNLIKARTPEQVWDEYRQFSASSYYNFAGMTRERLRKEHGLLWPCPTEEHPGTPRRYVEGVDPFVTAGTGMEFYGNPDKKAVVYLRPYVASPEQPSQEYPLLLTTGRVLEQWHTGTMTDRIANLAKTSGLAKIELNEQDAWALKVAAGDTVEVTSKFGTVRGIASVTDGPRRGVVFAAFWDVRLLINKVVADHFDAASREPEFKVTAVRVRKVEA